MRALYQLPTPPGNGAALELHLSDRGRVAGDQWPAELVVSCRLGALATRPWQGLAGVAGTHDCQVSYDAPLPFPPASFDLVILHHTLDELAAVFRNRSAHQVAGEWLQKIAAITRPGGVVVGCGLNRTSPRSRLRHQGAASATAERPALGIFSCRAALLRAGLQDVQVFNLWPDADAPSTIASIDAAASRRAFRYVLESTRESLSRSGYLTRRLVAELGINRFLEETLFFWGYKPC
ncbi:MAG TPA: hypothetical protein DIT03_18015 [Candidatus Accumulibacter sp.]|nr:hypothetical protein [Accumulibacter sp.]